MRILIKTFRLSSNYGCILQAYALQKVIRDLGHEVVTWDTNAPFYSRMSYSHRILSIAKQLVRKYILREKNVIVDIDRFAAKRSEQTCQNTKLFVQKHIERIIEKDLRNLSGEHYDCVVAGSDQIWRFYGGEQALKDNYLEFTKKWDCKRIAYAVSFGLNKPNYSEELKLQCKQLIKHFDAVSVREASGVDICKTEFGIDATLVLDPTLLLKKEDYIALINGTDENKMRGGLIFYILDENEKKTQIVKKIASQLALTTHNIGADSENPTIPFDWRVQPPVECWIKGFYEAEFIVTDSFHACVFSIIFNKPFVCLGNEHRGMTRFHSLLSMFNLQGRLINPKTSDLNSVIQSTIDWLSVNEKLDKLRNSSYSYLINNLSN